MDKIIILDFGSQFTQLIARRVRELNVYSEIFNYNTPISKIVDFNPNAIILSGGPNSIYEKNAPTVPKEIFNLNIPILAICYGMQAITHYFGGKVVKSNKREFGKSYLQNYSGSLFKDLKDGENNGKNYLEVLMSHSDQIKSIPKDFKLIGSTKTCKYAAIANYKLNIFGLQFHPEVTHTNKGKEIFTHFIFDICKCKPSWNMNNFLNEQSILLKNTLKNDKVILAISGGLDSSVVALILKKIIHSNLICIFVDTGLLRLNEPEEIMNIYNSLGLNVIKINAQKKFLKALQMVVDPEEKRKVIGKLFIEIFEKEARKITDIKWLAQGTIYPDIIESAHNSKTSQTIKSHHNVGGLPKNLKLKLIEPIKTLFKDEVRSIGNILNLPDFIINKHPFPGPGLAVRIIGEVNSKFIKILKLADYIFIDELRKNKLYLKVSQAFAVFLPIKTVGVMGDGRTYEYLITLRSVDTNDFMTANVSILPLDFLIKVSNRITNEVEGINRVLFDISSKPPATIEWE